MDKTIIMCNKKYANSVDKQKPCIAQERAEQYKSIDQLKRAVGYALHKIEEKNDQLLVELEKCPNDNSYFNELSEEARNCYFKFLEEHPVPMLI